MPQWTAQSWPHDDTYELQKFYGKPWETPALLTHVVPPFQMYYEGTLVHGLLVHVKIGPALLAGLSAVKAALGGDQSTLNASGWTNYSGAFAFRNVRGASRLSCHSFGAALDIDAEHNSLGIRGGRLSKRPELVKAFCDASGAFWGGSFKTRADEMHFQFAHE